MAESPFIPLIEVWRGAIIESIHSGCVAVVDADGQLLASAGDPEHVTFLRSSSKPMQAIPLIEAGGAELFDLNDAEIAIICSSHNGSAEHVRLITALQARLGLREDQMLCGTHMPGDPQEALRLTLAGESPNQRHHNCSGKHTGMLAYAKMRGLPLEDYVNPQHPIQQTILQVMADMCGVQTTGVIVGIDGCSVPVFGMSMRQAAYGYARLADPRALSPQRSAACRKITKAMIAQPEMVAGTARFDTRLMQAASGKLVCKSGAEGCFAVGVLPDALAPGSPGIGITMKIADGALGRRGGKPSHAPPDDGDLDHRGLPLAALAVLRQMGILSAAELNSLAAFDQRRLHNWRHLVVGEVRANFTLQKYHP